MEISRSTPRQVWHTVDLGWWVAVNGDRASRLMSMTRSPTFAILPLTFHCRLSLTFQLGVSLPSFATVTIEDVTAVILAYPDKASVAGPFPT